MTLSEHLIVDIAFFYIIGIEFQKIADKHNDEHFKVKKVVLFFIETILDFNQNTDYF